jgi:hypothetical protein
MLALAIEGISPVEIVILVVVIGILALVGWVCPRRAVRLSFSRSPGIAIIEHAQPPFGHTGNGVV